MVENGLWGYSTFWRSGPPVNRMKDLETNHPRLFLLVLVVWVLIPRPAHAYLDPASGSLILQLVLGGIAGLAMLLKLYWHKLRNLLGLSKEKSEAE